MFASLKSDAVSGLVVFLVALPLCLGVAVASGASPFAGIISGVIGGIVVGYLSNSQVSVSGPAAGLIAIVLVAIKDMGYEAFILAVVLAGVFQLLLGMLKAGTISNYFPFGVIEGMLTGIGIIIVKKELPHAIGYDKEHEGDFYNYSLTEQSDSGFFNELIHSFNFAHTGIIIVTLITISSIIAFNKLGVLKKIKLLPGALVAVIVGILINELFRMFSPGLVISGDHLVSLPIANSVDDFMNQFTFPDFSAIVNPKVWIVAATIAAVASIESLLSLEAGDKLDPDKRYSNANTELKAQGIGNITAGLIGGIPMTSVIVRTSANITAGAKTKLSTIIHGLLLLLTVIFIPTLLNKIPMACLAGILIMIGLKLTSPKVFKHMWHTGKFHFIPFMVTVVGVVGLDLLKGVGIGLLVCLIFVLTKQVKFVDLFKSQEPEE